jgi:PAS domain S-box-containing protein
MKEVFRLPLPSIAFVLPFESLAETARSVAAELGIPVQTAVGDLDKGVEQARLLAAAGAEVIISRGGTARMIDEAVALPVVEIRVTSSDVLRSFKQIDPGFRGQVGLAGFKNIIYGCAEVGELLGLEMVDLPVPNQAEAHRLIAGAAAGGVAAGGVAHIIGDHISYIEARALGLGATLIGSGREGIAQALFEARHVLNVSRQEREKSQRMGTIIDTVSDGILAVDADGRVILFNPQAERLFGLKAAEVLGRDVVAAIPGTRMHEVLATGRPQVGELQQVGTTTIAATRRPVRVGAAIVGAVSTFRDVTELQRYERLVRQKLHQKGLVARHSLAEITGSSPAVQRVLREARRYAPTDATVLILGESGTGKELLAQGIHLASRRGQGPFVAVNCAAVPETLLESELFGYAEGAFTGARRGGKQGLFELAHGGTIFLDEIGEMPLPLQSRLLRVLQEKEVMRVGAEGVIPVDVRVVAATNRDLEQDVPGGRFRADLFYRLDILRLVAPPLRERLADLPELVAVLSAGLRQKHGTARTFAPEAVAALARHRWPGNVRELENFLERLWLVAEGEPIPVEVVLAYLPDGAGGAAGDPGGRGEPGGRGDPDGRGEPGDPAPVGAGPAAAPWPPDLTLKEIEALAIQRALAAEGGNLQRAAARLGLHRTTLYRKLQPSDANGNE